MSRQLWFFSERVIARVERWLGRPGAPYLVAALGLVLMLPALTTGWVLDDNVQSWMLEPGAPEWIARPPHRLYSFLLGSDGWREQAASVGFLPWFADPAIHAEFWRPLASWDRYLDYLLWPDSALLAHVHGLAWFFALTVIVGLVYRRLMPAPWLGGLATLLFAVDEAHGQPVGWIANRHATIAMVFAGLALLFHIRWRQDRWRAGAVLGPVMLAAGLAAGEMALSVTAYLFAFALLLDRGTWRTRVATLLPCAAVCVAWRVVYDLGGYGATGSGLYLDPAAEPLRYLGATLTRLPLLIQAQLTPVSSDGIMFLPPAVGVALTVSAVVSTGVVGAIVWRWLRRDRLALFWCLSMVVAALPACATFANDRMLMALGIGGMGMVAALIGRVLSPSTSAASARAPSRAERGLAGFWLVTHLVVAPLLLPLYTYSNVIFKAPFEAGFRSLDRAGDLTGRTLVLVAAPDSFWVMYLLSTRHHLGLSEPERLVSLSTVTSGASVTRVADRVLQLRADQGFMGSPFDVLYRHPGRPLRVGEVFRLPVARVEIVQIAPDGRPTELRVTFDLPLEDRSLVWVAWSPDGYVPFSLPAIGQSATIAPVTLWQRASYRYE